jgi:hypothetical protein
MPQVITSNPWDPDHISYFPAAYYNDGKRDTKESQEGFPLGF